MYVPSHFAMTAEEQEALLRSITAVDLITPTADGLMATFLPLLHREGALVGHVARNNPHWSTPPTGESMVIVRGPDAYVSPGWYPSKREHGRVVPTWNYVTAHVHGRLVVHDDPQWLRALVTELTTRHEAAQAQPWAVTDAPPEFIEGQLRAIVGLELQITRVEAKAKLSQNRPPADRDAVRAALAGTPVGDAMRG
jgi:transcriptional regulator